MSTTRLIRLITVFVCLLTISNFSSVFAYSFNDYWWQPEGNDCNWNNPDNWGELGYFYGPPNPDSAVYIPPAPIGPCINGDAACGCLTIIPWSWAGAPDIDVTVISGNFNCGDRIYLCTGEPTNCIGSLKVNGGTVTTPNAGATGLTIGGGWDGYGDSYGRVTMYGGLISVPRIALQFGDVNLFGGTLECTADGNFIFNQGRPQNKIDISGGTLKLKGNHVTELMNYINSGRIVCLRGEALEAPVYDGTWTTLSDTVNFNLAWDPSPEVNATNVHYKHSDGNSITLSWQPGDFAKQHDVYFGTSTGILVYQGTRYDANSDPLNWTIAAFNFKVNTNYYWRIDETNNSNVVSQGLVWKFKTHDGKAYNPKPINGAAALSEPLQLSWTAGDFAVSHQVFFGTDQGSVTFATTSTTKIYRGTVTNPSYPLTSLYPDYALIPGTTYYWKIVEVNGATTWGGGAGGAVVWSFTPAAYVNVDNFEDYNTTAELQATWATNYVTGCEPPANTNGAVTFIQSADGKYMNFSYRNNIGDVAYSETKLSYSPSTSFTGGGALSPAIAALSVSYRGTPTNGADPDYDRMYIALQDTAGNVGVLLNPDPDAALVTDWTTWYMALRDINSAGDPQPVNLQAVSAFAIGFGVRCSYDPLGNDGNVAFDNIRLYPQSCNPDFAHTHGLTADLDNDCDVDMNDLSIFMDSWLESEANRCWPVIVQPAAPILWYKFDDTGNTNEVIDYGSTGTYTGTVQRWAPINWDPTGSRTGGPCLYLPDIPPHTAMMYVDVPVAAVDGNGFMGDVAHSIANGGGGVTFSIWVNASFPGDFYTMWGSIFSIWNNNNQEFVEIPLPSRLGPGYSGSTATMAFMKHIYTPFWTTVSTGTSGLSLLDFGGRWNHWVFRKSPTQMAVYLNGYILSHIDANGQPGDPNAAVYGPLWNITEGVTAFRIGARGTNYAFWAGKISDFQIYDYALSDEEIAWLASDGRYCFLIPLTDTAQKANLKSSVIPEPNIIDFQDFAVFAQQWRVQILWP